MTDQTKQRISELYRVSGVHKDDIAAALARGIPEFGFPQLSPQRVERILAWHDAELARHSAASAAAALMVAKEFCIAEAERLGGGRGNLSAAADDCARGISALITPNQSAALASMLEEAEKRGANQAAIAALEGVIERDAWVRAGALVQIDLADLLDAAAKRLSIGDRTTVWEISSKIRALKDKGPTK